MRGPYIHLVKIYSILFIVFVMILILSNCSYSKGVDHYTISQYHKLKAISNCDLFITSGYRTASNNEKVGGSSHSYHLEGKAIDFVVPAACGITLFNMAKLATLFFNGVILYHKHIHVDTREGVYHLIMRRLP